VVGKQREVAARRVPLLLGGKIPDTAAKAEQTVWIGVRRKLRQDA